MTTKEYLSQAYRLDQRIHSKLEQVSTLRSLAQKMTVSFGNEGGRGVRIQSPMENALVKIIDMEQEINRDINNLIDLKHRIAMNIKSIIIPEQELLLELRYLGYKTWEEIGEIMGYSYRQVHRIHGEALRNSNLTVQ